MIIALYLVMANVVLKDIIYPISLILIVLTGCIMMLGTVGIRVSNNLGSTIVDKVFKGLAYIGRCLIKAIRWIIIRIRRLIPRTFRYLRAFYSRKLSVKASNILAGLTTFVLIAIII